jgi:hypothetical protein
MPSQYTIIQYNALCDAIAQGVTMVMYGDKRVEYRNLNDMLRVKALMEADLGIKTNVVRKKSVRFTKGLL